MTEIEITSGSTKKHQGKETGKSTKYDRLGITSKLDTPLPPTHTHTQEKVMHLREVSRWIGKKNL